MDFGGCSEWFFATSSGGERALGAERSRRGRRAAAEKEEEEDEDEDAAARLLGLQRRR